MRDEKKIKQTWTKHIKIITNVVPGKGKEKSRYRKKLTSIGGAPPFFTSVSFLWNESPCICKCSLLAKISFKIICKHHEDTYSRLGGVPTEMTSEEKWFTPFHNNVYWSLVG